MKYTNVLINTGYPMIKTLSLCLAWVLIILSPAHSKYSEEGVTPGFRSMLRAPNAKTIASAKDDSFATQVTRPYAQNPNQDMSFFSNPKATYGSWNSQHKDYTGNHENISAFTIFETMGTSRRGVLNEGNARYDKISNAEMTGMLGLLKGDLGFRERLITESETRTMIRELLSVGHSMNDSALAATVQELERAYKETTNTRYQQHFQVSALLMLKGHGKALENSAWYLNGANISLPKEPSTPKSPVTINPRDVVIDRLRYQEPGKAERRQEIFGTSGVSGSPLHSSLGEARYPNVMILGSHKTPMKQPKDMFSITAEVSPDYYLMIMQPEDNRDPVLRPQYMEVSTGSPTTAEGRGTSNVEVIYLDKAIENLTIDWSVERPSGASIVLPSDFKDLGKSLHSPVSQVKPTEKKANDGQLTLSPPRKIEDEDGDTSYSFVAKTRTHGRTRHFYYWCPTPSQMNEIQYFATHQNGPFTTGELHARITKLSKDIAVPDQILQEINSLLDGRLNDFSN